MSDFFAGVAPTAASFNSSAEASTSCAQYARLFTLRVCRAPVPFVEGAIDAAQHRFQRDAGILPDFHQRPVERGQNDQRAAALLEVLFDFGEIVEVIIHAKKD